jgi:hypothetical protein
MIVSNKAFNAVYTSAMSNLGFPVALFDSARQRLTAFTNSAGTSMFRA